MIRVVGAGNLWRRADRHHHGCVAVDGIRGRSDVDREPLESVVGVASVSVVFVILAAVALEFITVVEEF
jgi:hypothetical protein